MIFQGGQPLSQVAQMASGKTKLLTYIYIYIAIVLRSNVHDRFQISRQFAQVGAKVIMVNRKEEQGDEAIKQIREETPGADVDWVGCDLGNLKEVKQVFSDLRQQLDRLDLVSNVPEREVCAVTD